MELDGIEIVMEFEDEFQISIADRDAEKLDTIGPIVEKSKLRNETHCIKDLDVG